MFAVLSHRFKTIILFPAVLLGVSVTSFAHADTSAACFNFLKEDYVRAEAEAKLLLKKRNLKPSEQRSAHLCLGRAYDGMEKSQDALAEYLQVEVLSQTIKDRADAYRILSYSYYELHELVRAELYSQFAFDEFTKLADKDGEISSLNFWAMAASQRGNQSGIEQALSLYLKVLALQSDGWQKLNTMNNVAHMYQKIGQTDKAVQMLRQSIALEKRFGDELSVARKHGIIGTYLTRGGDLDEAEKELTLQLNAEHLFGEKRSEASVCELLAGIAFDRQRMILARQWYGKAEAIYREMGDVGHANETAAISASLQQ